MAMKLKWKKRAFSNRTLEAKAKETCSKNEADCPLFVIEKSLFGSDKGRFRLFSSIEGMFPKIVAKFKTQAKAKQVAQMIFSDSRYAKQKQYK